MGFGNWIGQGVGLLGKHAMRIADAHTGGLASKVANKTIGFMDRNAGTIGKVARTLGQHFLSDDTRGKLQNYAQTAIKYMPEGKVRTALNKISQAAQGKEVKAKAKLLTPAEMKARAFEQVKHPEVYKAKQAEAASRKEKRRAKRAERKAASGGATSGGAIKLSPKSTSSSTTTEGLSQAVKSASKSSIFDNQVIV